MATTNSSFIFPAEPTFTVVDYVVFAGFLCISGGVGIFYSLKGQGTTEEYFYGNREMKAVPVGISTGVSFLSASLYVGLPAEVFINGYSYMIGLFFASIGYFMGCILVSHVLHPLRMTSLNEYLAMRFKSKILNVLANIMVLVCILEYMGLCMFGSVIAFNTVTGGQVSVVVGLAIGGVVGIFYTSIGGLKAVVWTDVIQSGVMLIGIFTVIIQSIRDTPGGMAAIDNYNRQYRRIHALDWSTDMTIRHTGWGMTLGMFVCWGVWCVQPACVQRLCSTKGVKDGYIVAGITGGLFILFTMLPGWAGINIFGYYMSKGCDVFAAGWIEKNEIILYYVRERLNFPGFQGLFIAALYAGSLSSLSSGLNSASAVLWSDTIKPMLWFEVSDVKATLISKCLVVIFGVVGMIWCYVLYSFGGLILQVASSIDSSIYGAYCSLFLFSVCFRYANYKGAIAGLIVSFVVTLWLGLGSILHGKSTVTKLPSNTEFCGTNITRNSSAFEDEVDVVNRNSQDSVFDKLYSISYVWLATICLGIYLSVGLIVTACTKPARKTDTNLLCFLSRPGNCMKSGNGTECTDSLSEDSEDLKQKKEDVKLQLEVPFEDAPFIQKESQSA